MTQYDKTAADIMTAYLKRHQLAASDVAPLLAAIMQALATATQPPPSPKITLAEITPRIRRKRRAPTEAPPMREDREPIDQQELFPE
jgi:predicted transcriptional regulator